MAWIESHWERVTPVSASLLPLAWLFGAAAGARRAAYRAGALKSIRLPVPVIVVGNITVGGAGKTPLTLWLAGFLRSLGRKPGVVCRGYGGRADGARRVAPDADPIAFGDEAVLLARRSGCEVWTGADRAAAARALLDAQPACDVVLSDDGLQHYALARDLELCVVDADRGFGNGWLLPAGPLREPPARLAAVDAVVFNDNSRGTRHPSVAALPGGAARFSMRLAGRKFRNLLDSRRLVGAEFFRNKRVHAVAGIGHPPRFFSTLRELGLDFAARPFPDHHPFTESDLAYAGAESVLMTEKDAVKCRRFARETYWELAVDAAPDPGLGELLARKLGIRG